MKVSVAGAWVGLIVTVVGGGMKVGAADQKIRHLEQMTTQQQIKIESQQMELREQSERTIRIEEQTKGIEASTVRIEDLIRRLQH